MAEPLGDEERRDIVEAAKRGDSCTQIAKRHGRAKSTVSKIADEAGVPFSRAQTAAATALKQEDNRARRAELAALLLDDAHRMRAQLWEPCQRWEMTKDGDWMSVHLDEPTFQDKRAITQSVRALMQTVAEMEKVDRESSEGMGEIDRIIDHLDGDTTTT